MEEETLKNGLDFFHKRRTLVAILGGHVFRCRGVPALHTLCGFVSWAVDTNFPDS